MVKDTYLSFRYNIRYGRFDAADEELDDAAKGADIHSKILTFPDGRYFVFSFVQ